MNNRSRLLGVFVAVAIGSLILVGCSAESPSAGGTSSSAPKTLTIGTNAAIATFNQALIGGGTDEPYWRAVYVTLLTRDTKGDLKPDAAESWSYDKTNTVLTMQIRKGMTFTDGSTVDAAAAVASLTNMKNGTGPDRVRFNNTKSITAPSKYTLRIELNQPDPAFLNYMSFDSGSIANPKHLKDADSASNPQGSGPYTLDQSRTTIGSQYTFVRNKNYWDLKSYPYETVVMKVLPDVTSRLNALKSGQIDTAQLNGATAAEAKASGLHYITQLGNMNGIQIRDTTGSAVKALGNEKVRQAMNMAFDRTAIVKNLLHGFGQPTDQQFTNTSEAYLKGEDDHYKYDVAGAKKLMAEAGYPNGFSMTMPTESSQTFLNPTIQQSLGAIGIKVSFVTVPDVQWVTKMLAGTYPLYVQPAASRTAWIDLGLWIGPGSTWNQFKPPSEDTQLTDLINQARVATPAQSPAIYQKIGKRLLTLAWFVPLYRDEGIDVANKTVNLTYTPQVGEPLIQNYSPAD
jgi:peptide/nickel transport system substrate-binding protein